MKIKFKDKITIILILLIALIWLIWGCNDYDPLRNAKFPAIVIEENKAQDCMKVKDSENTVYYFTNKEYCARYDTNDVILEPLIAK